MLLQIEMKPMIFELISDPFNEPNHNNYLEFKDPSSFSRLLRAITADSRF